MLRANSVSETNTHSRKSVNGSKQETKKNPPCVASGLFEDSNAIGQCDDFTKAVLQIRQARFWIQGVIREHQKYLRSDMSPNDLSIQNRSYMETLVDCSHRIYVQCYNSKVRDEFEHAFDVKFEDFEFSMIWLGIILGRHTEWAGPFGGKEQPT